MMAIEMMGGVYCPLSPRDPEHRLHSLVEQTQSRLVLLHCQTKTKFDQKIHSLDIDSLLDDHHLIKDGNVDRLSDIMVTRENIAYIIFTSGSTGIPKAVSNEAHNRLITFALF